MLERKKTRTEPWSSSKSNLMRPHTQSRAQSWHHVKKHVDQGGLNFFLHWDSLDVTLISRWFTVKQEIPFLRQGGADAAGLVIKLLTTVVRM